MFVTWCVDIYMNGGFREECGGGYVLTSGVVPQFMYGNDLCINILGESVPHANTENRLGEEAKWVQEKG